MLLDEMYRQSIARQLRQRGRDAIAITEQPDLRGLTDAEIFAVAQEQRRGVVTENIADFVPLADQADMRGTPHYGLVLVDPAKYRRGAPRTIGRIVEALDGLLHEHSDEAAISVRLWL